MVTEQYGDSTQLLYLRARHYSPTDGRFTSRDTWSGDYNRPLSLNRWMYLEGNPVNFADPSGQLVCPYGCDSKTGKCLPNPINALIGVYHFATGSY
jgi:RHS repeat-associated protein